MEDPDQQQISAAEALQSVRSRGPSGWLIGPGSIAASPAMPGMFGLLGPNGLLGGGLPQGRSFNAQMGAWNDEGAQGRRGGLGLADAMRWADAQEGTVPAELALNSVVPFGGAMANTMRLRRATNMGFGPDRYYWAARTPREIRGFAPGIHYSEEALSPDRHAYLLSSSPQQALSRVGISAADEGAQVLALRVALGRTGVADIPAGTDISRELAPNLALWRDAGLDSIRLLMPRGDPLLAVFNPRNIRSVNAQFDPRRAGSRDILAGIGGGVVAVEACGADPSSEPGSPP